MHTASIARLSVLGEGSLLCCSPWGFSHFPFKLWVFLWKCFLVRCEGLRTEGLRTEGLRTEGVVLSYWYSEQTVKSTETNVTFVILGYINKHWLIDDNGWLMDGWWMDGWMDGWMMDGWWRMCDNRSDWLVVGWITDGRMDDSWMTVGWQLTSSSVQQLYFKSYSVNIEPPGCALRV